MAELRYETQVDLLRLLHRVSQHYSIAALSLRVDRAFDGARILTMACIATIADAVLRLEACDVPSELSMHYSGRCASGGPPTGLKILRPFGVEMRQFAAESALFLLHDPALMIIRTQVLDYFEHQRTTIDDDHVLFRWERSMECGTAERQLLDQICLEVGCEFGGRVEGRRAGKGRGGKEGRREGEGRRGH